VEILIMQVFVSLILVLGSVLLFLFTAKQRDFDHADRLALFPLDDDPDPTTTTTPKARPEGADRS
jgi:hypothetical protein